MCVICINISRMHKRSLFLLVLADYNHPGIRFSLTELLCVPMRLLLCKSPSLDLFIDKMAII